MTATINGHVLSVTGEADLQSCVRAPEIPVGTADPAGDAQESVRRGARDARAIPDKIRDVKANATTKVGDFVSLHAGEVGAAAAGSVTLNEPPMTVAEAWRQVPPAAGEVSSRTGWLAATGAGLFRAAGLSVLYVLALAIGTRTRAGVAAVLLILTVAVALAVQAAHP